MHDIHWAVIFSNAGYLCFPAALLVIGWRLWREAKRPQGAKKIYSRDRVSVTLSTGEECTGIVSGVARNAGSGFTIICAPADAAVSPPVPEYPWPPLNLRQAK